MIRTIKIFFQFLWHDFFVHKKQLKDYAINYVLIYPFLYSIAFAYLQARIFFGSEQPLLGTILFAGNILVVLMVFTYKQNISLLFDLENERFIDYQICILSPRLLILERIIFTALLTFTITIPFFPIGKLLLRDNMQTANTSWFQLFVILFLASCCCSAYHQLATIILKKSEQIRSLWARVNSILITFGGFWIPWHIINTYSKILGSITLLNPLIYISEGLKQALVSGTEFFSFTFCIIVLIFFSSIFTLFSWYFFKKRVDHI